MIAGILFKCMFVETAAYCPHNLYLNINSKTVQSLNRRCFAALLGLEPSDVRSNQTGVLTDI